MQVFESVFDKVLDIRRAFLKSLRLRPKPSLNVRRLARHLAHRVQTVAGGGGQCVDRNRIASVEPKENCSLKLRSRCGLFRDGHQISDSAPVCLRQRNRLSCFFSVLQNFRRALWASAIFTVVRVLYGMLDAIGNFQTARELIPRAPAIAQFIVQVLYWPLTGPLVCLGCLIALVALDRRRTSKTKTTVTPVAFGGTQDRQVIVPTITDSPQEVKREIIDVEPDYLMGFFDEHTSIQAQRLIEPYIGKWTRVSGPLGDVRNNEYFSQIVFDRPRGTYTTIYMYFHQSDRSDRLSILRRGTKLTVLGQIKEVRAYEFHLANCELI